MVRACRSIRQPVLGLLVTVVMAVGSSNAAATTLTFEDIGVNQFGSKDLTPNGGYAGGLGYGGLAWSSLWGIDTASTFQNLGNTFPFPSGVWVLGGSGGAMSVGRPLFSGPNSCCVPGIFNFHSAYFAPNTINDGMWHNAAYSVALSGWLNGNMIYSQQHALVPGFSLIQANFIGIDTLLVQPFNNGFGITHQMLMDDFTFTLPGDAAAVPEPTTLALLAVGLAAAARGLRRRRNT